jgi:hypothetical protein
MSETAKHPSLEELEAGLSLVRLSPAGCGRVETIVRRPAVDQREIVDEALLDTAEGLVGDTWRARGNRRTVDGSADPDAQLTLMNVRAATLIAGSEKRRVLAGDQIFVDFDLSGGNIPPGTRLSLGMAIVEVSDKPHTGCEKFAARFGHEALRFVNSYAGRELNLRGINTRVVYPGIVRVGDPVLKIPARKWSQTRT